VDDYEGLARYLLANYATSGILVVTQSMGTLPMLNLLKRQTVPIVAMYIIAGVTNLKYEYDNFPTFAGQIRTAYGIASDGSDYAAKTAGFDPNLADPRAFRGVPMRLSTYDADDTVPPAQNGTAFLAKVAPYASESSSVTYAGTSHIGGAAFVPSDTDTFFRRYLPRP
jgi:hypothetical protein